MVAPRVIRALLSPEIRKNPNKTISRMTGVAANKNCIPEKLDTGSRMFMNWDEMIIKFIGIF